MALELEKKYISTENRWSVKLKGEVDISTVPKFKTMLEDIFKEKEEDIALILDDLDYIDSTGLGAIIGAYGRMKEKNKTLVLVRPGVTLKKLLGITSLDQVFVIEEN